MARHAAARLAQATILSVAMLLGAISCSDLGTAPPVPVDPGFIDAVAPDALKHEADAAAEAAAPSASLAPLAALSAASSAAGPTYTVSKIAFAPEPRSGLTQLPGADDWSFGGNVANRAGPHPGLALGFDFTFYGKTYNKFFISTNGVILFDYIEEGACCGAAIPLNDAPTATIPRPKNNLIALAWNDFVPLGGQISYGVRGAAPRRRMIVDYNQVGFFVCHGCPPSAQKVTTQAVLYEGTNVIEIHTTLLQNPGTKAVTQGVENAAGVEAAFLPERNRKVFSLANDAVRFAPPAAQNRAPVANAGGNAGRYEGVEGAAIQFVGSGSDADNDALTFAWDFNNDGVGDSTSAETRHVYADNGEYTATLLVSDGRGGVGQASVKVVVKNDAPSVDAGSDVRISAGESVGFSGQFSDKGVKDAPWRWVWDLGSLGSYNGNAENQAAAVVGSKRFCKAGSFPVKLTVVDKDGGSGSDELVVTVDALPVQIDVDPNTINLNGNGHGMVTVRIYSRDGLDATALNPDAIRLTNGSGHGTQLARNGSGRWHWNADADLNGDGRLDVSAGFRRDELIANGDLTPNTAELSLSGEVGSCGDALGKAPVRVMGPGRAAR
jgi:PKD repeat protein